MRRPSLLVALLVCAAPAAVRADVVSLSAQIHGGGAAGRGLGGDRKDDAFHDGTTGGTYGARLGVEILFVDVWVQHDQYRDSERLLGTWTQLMTGFDVELDLGDQKGGTRNDRGEVDGGYSAGYAEFGLGFGFGLGTGQQVEPPLDNGEIPDKGVVGQVHVGVGWRLSPSWSLGVQVPVQGSYLIKSGSGATANDTGTHYTEASAAALLALRINLGK